MMLTWWVLLSVIASYVAIVSIFPFEGVIGNSIHFTRLTVTIAATIIYVQMIPSMFRGDYSRSVTYLFTSINFFLISLVCFSFWNEAGRLWGVDTRVLYSAIPGAFSLCAIIAAVFALLSAATGSVQLKAMAIIIGIILSAGLVFIAPFFR